jgi:hypothetical protein
MEAYPNAKVVLSVRTPEKWHKSVKESVYQFHLMKEDFAVKIFTTLVGKRNNLLTVDAI